MAAIALPRLIRLGGGTLNELPEVLAEIGVSKPFVVTDPFLARTGPLDRLTRILGDAGVPVRVFDRTVSDPIEASVAETLAAFKEGDHDCVVAFGGGSPIDTAKAVAVLAVRGGRMAPLKAPHAENTAGLPIIAIPTTAGTGSEATRFTIITDEATDEKMLCAGTAYLPTAAIVDFELTMTKPRRLTADTGIDSLTHAIEAYVSKKANPFSDGMALAAMRSIWPHLKTACDQPDNRAAREAMMAGALQAGIAFSNASVALVHGMSRPIGAHFHVPHGLSNAMLLPLVTGFSAHAALPRYAVCARTMGIAGDREGDQSAVARLVDSLAQLNAELEVPTPKAYGIDGRVWRDLTPLMAQQALASGSPGNNPYVPSAAEIEDLYARAWS